VAGAQEDCEEGVVVLVVQLGRGLEQLPELDDGRRLDLLGFPQFHPGDFHGLRLQIAQTQVKGLLGDIGGSHYVGW